MLVQPKYDVELQMNEWIVEFLDIPPISNSASVDFPMFLMSKLGSRLLKIVQGHSYTINTQPLDYGHMIFPMTIVWEEYTFAKKVESMVCAADVYIVQAIDEEYEWTIICGSGQMTKFEYENKKRIKL